MQVLENGTLYFHKVRWYYAGKYACVAENPGGVAVFYIHVKIHDGTSKTYLDQYDDMEQ